VIAEPGYSGPTALDKRGNQNFTTINAVFYNPLSRGRTHISSTDYNARPAVDPAYWSHPVDVAMHVASYQAARKLLQTPPLRSIYVQEFEPGVDVQSDKDVEAYLKTVANSDNHEVGTMAMMPEALGGVVDTQFRVYGLENVRVTDASVIPMPISSHMVSCGCFVVSCDLTEVKFVGVHCLYARREGEGFAVRYFRSDNLMEYSGSTIHRSREKIELSE
jgi:choline dehydrogenase-like flavoprotein